MDPSSGTLGAVEDHAGAASPEWDALLADLEAQWDNAAAAEVYEEADERLRAARLAAGWLERLRASRGRELVVSAAGLGTVAGRLGDCGPDWVSLAQARGELVVALAAISWIRGLADASVPDELVGALERRWGLRLVLAGLSRRRRPVELSLRDGSRFGGTLDRVGADYLELLEHPLGEWARADGVAGRRAVPLSAVAGVLVSG